MFAISQSVIARLTNARTKRLVSGTVIALMLVAVAPAANAQFGGGFGGGNSGLNSRDLRQYGDILGLDDEQREVVQILFEDYMQETEEITNKLRTQMETAREEMRSGGGGDFSQFRQIAEKAGEDRSDLQERFLGDVRVILGEDQAEQWPSLERAIRRNQSLRRGFMSGERVDLTKVVTQVELNDASLTEVNSSLGQYEVDLDRAIVARDEGQARAMSQAREVWSSGDEGAIGDLFDKQRKLSVRVRDVNRRYAREIEGMLVDDEQIRFMDAFKQASFPQVFRPGRAQRVLDLVLRYEDLSDEQRTTVDGIGEVFGRDVSKLNEQHIAAIEESEMSMTIQDMFRGRGGDRGGRGGQRGGDREQTPQEKVAERKRELDTKTIANIERALNEGQATKLEGQLAKLREQEREQRRGGRDGGFRRDR